MIDLILAAPDKATLAAFTQAHPAGNPLIDADGNQREGFDWCWWAGSGLFTTQAGTYDGDGNEITPPSYYGGVVALVRVYGQFFDADVIDPSDPDYDATEQWGRSRLAKYIKNNGTSGSTPAGWPYWELDGVKLFKPETLEAFLSANSLPGHVWLGGNNY